MIAPEIHVEGVKEKEDRACYTKKVDIWSMGVVLYQMFSDENPFDDTEDVLLGPNEVCFRDGVRWSAVSTPEAQGFIEKLLVKDASVRYSIEDVLADVWLSGDAKSVTIVEEVTGLKIKTTEQRTALPKDDNKENGVKECFRCPQTFSAIQPLFDHLETAHGIRVYKTQETGHDSLDNGDDGEGDSTLSASSEISVDPNDFV